MHWNALAVLLVLSALSGGLLFILAQNNLPAERFQPIVGLLAGVVYGMVYVLKTWARLPAPEEMQRDRGSSHV